MNDKLLGLGQVFANLAPRGGVDRFSDHLRVWHQHDTLMFAHRNPDAVQETTEVSA